MKIATAPAAADPALAGFVESRGSMPAPAGCGCLGCAARVRMPARAARAGDSRIHRTVRGTCLATTVVAGAGVVALSAGTGVAHAAPAPVKQGWDGSKYWFKGVGGEWRYTSHYDVYLNRMGAKPAAPAGQAQGTAPKSTTPKATAPKSTAGASGTGPEQGWDGSKYWFRSVSGEWRYTSHYDVYLSRVGQGAASAAGPGTGSAAEGPESDGPDAAEGTDRGSTETAVAYALAQVGKPYVWGGNGPGGFDCSGLVQQAYRKAGVSLPRVAGDQYAATTPIDAGDLRRGDLLFWSDSGRASAIHHVGIYLGGGRFVEAPRPGKNVRVSTLSSGFYPTHFGRP
ncbi:NlpC/P60 family protein [Kitasatospora sp. NBC_00240]|uniref:C40 family peptidase n=1 Tax=Kitasatospora sp. NBC_00240 TaxID=2903567 RepID=UPI00225A8991|nr:C40 family peptidase [Kitasatospora sp. NBC_00240]MCX5211914.1 NlpC/P60 family protein [Kitasatospora sp. NBC_00240]